MGWVSPFVMMVAAASFIELSDPVPGQVGGLGAAMGFLAFLCTVGGGGVRWVVDLAGSLVGGVATVALTGAYLSGETCGPGSTPTRALSLVFLAALFAFCAIPGIALRPARWPKVGLAAFGSLEMLIFLSSPLGVELGPLGLAATTGVACLLGGLSGLFPDIMMVVAATGFGLAMIATDVTVGSACTIPGTSAGWQLVAAYLAVLVISSVIARPFRRTA